MSPGAIDREVVRRHLVAIDLAVQHLRKYQGRSAEALEADLDALWAVERGLQLCAQNALDIATHLVAGAGRDAIDYTTTIDQLSALGVLPDDFAKRFRPVAGFRNILVHAYLEVDPRRLHALLNERLDDFVTFSRLVQKYLA